MLKPILLLMFLLGLVLSSTVQGASSSSYSLVWSKQIDTAGIIVTSVPQGSGYIMVESTTPHVYLVSLADGSIAYSSPTYNTLKGQYGVLRLEPPKQAVSSSDGSVSAWITSAKWLHIVIIGKTTTYLSIQLSDIPTSIGMVDDGSYIFVGTHSGLLLEYQRL